MKLFFAQTIGVPEVEGGGVGEFFKEKVAKPVGKAGVAAGKAVGKAAKWTWDKLTGED